MKKDSKHTRLVRARVCDGDNATVECSVTVCDGRIESIDRAAGLGMVDIDVEGRWLLPGAIDAHVHFDDPGFTHREDFASGTIAAAAGGVTTVIDMPCTCIPPVTDFASLERKLRVIGPKARVDYALWGGVRGNGFSADAVKRSLQSLYSCGVRSIKTYLVSGMPTFEDLTVEQMREVMLAASDIGLTVGVHAEDKKLVTEATASEKAGGEGDGALAYSRSRSAQAEARGIATCIELAEATHARVHVVHVACGEGVRLLREAKARGVPISAETCPHYLVFTVEDLLRMGSLLKTAPVVKSAADREALWEGIADGTIDMVATDHAPGQWPVEKQSGSIWTDYGGVPGVELLVPLLLSEGVAKGRITLSRALELLSSEPARIHGLGSRKGALHPGMDADFAVVDAAAKWTVRAEHLMTRQKYTPFEGMELTGNVMRTFVRGQEVFSRDLGILGPPCGQLVVPQHDPAA